MILRYDLGGSGLRLLDGEHLEVYRTGAFELWRLRGSPVVGRFAGHLEPDALAELRRLSAAAAAASGASAAASGAPVGRAATARPSSSPAAQPIEPHDARAERWMADDAVLLVTEGREAPGAWRELIVAGRRLLDSLTNRPLAAVELTVADDWRSATLRHRGREPLEVDPASLRLEAAVWRGHFDLVGTWSAGALDLGTATIGPGWSEELELGHRFRAGRRRVLHVTAGFDVLVGDARAHLAAQVAPAMEPI